VDVQLFSYCAALKGQNLRSAIPILNQLEKKGVSSLFHFIVLIFFESISKTKLPGRFFSSHFFQLWFSFTFAFPKKWVNRSFCLGANKLIQKVL